MTAIVPIEGFALPVLCSGLDAVVEHDDQCECCQEQWVVIRVIFDSFVW